MTSSILYFNTRDELLRVDLKRVIYFEADGNYTKIVSSNGLTSMVLLNLGKMEELLMLRSKTEPSGFHFLPYRLSAEIPDIRTAVIPAVRIAACTVAESHIAQIFNGARTGHPRGVYAP